MKIISIGYSLCGVHTGAVLNLEHKMSGNQAMDWLRNLVDPSERLPQPEWWYVNRARERGMEKEGG